MIRRLKNAFRSFESHALLGPPLRLGLAQVRAARGLSNAAPVPAKRTKAPVRPERILLIASFDPQGIQTVIENIEYWGQLSRFSFDVLNLYLGPNKGEMQIPRKVDLNAYDGILVHATVSYNVASLLSLDRTQKTLLRDYRGIKVVMKQDEHYKARSIAGWVGSRGFHGVISACRPQEAHVFYPREEAGDVQFVHALTGYVSDRMLGLRYPLTDERKVDIGYRGSVQPLNFGRLSWEKVEIGDRFIEVCKARGLSFDISSRYADRISGEKWFDFLGGIKGVLGVETGASIVDWDGEVEAKVQAFARQYPDAPFQQLYDTVLQPYENKTYYKAIAPRHLEAAATKTVQIMYEGEYGGIFQEGRHYLSLRRDFSNLDEVLEKFADPRVRRELTECAYEEIIRNPRYHYNHFVGEVDDMLERLFDKPRANP